MSTKTADSLIAEMEKNNIFKMEEMTFCEYVENLINFQNMITKLAMGDEYAEGMRLDEVIFRLEAKAREKGISGDLVFRKGISALKVVNKELAISMAGKKGENLVARTLEYITRPNTKTYRNIYVSNGENETELDTVLVTDSGIIILEIKNTKDDVTITPEGRLVHASDACYEKKPLCEKMGNKRKLLKEKLEALSNEYGYKIPIVVESLIVFSTPKGIRIRVDDQLRKERWCFRTDLPRKIDNYVGRAYYSESQITQLDEMMAQLETQVKRFALTVNFNEIRADIAGALMLLEENEIKVEDVYEQEQIKQTDEKAKKVNVTDHTRTIVEGYATRTFARKIAAVAASVICAGAAAGISALVSRRAA